MPAVSDPAGVPPEAEEILNRLLVATATSDYEAFLAPGTDRFREGISREMFEGVSLQVAGRLKAGHTTEFLSQIGSCEHRVYLWKLSFTGGGDDYVSRLVLTIENEVAGFMLN